MSPLRIAVLTAPLFLAGACTKLGHIQQTEPVRTLDFTGPPKLMAQCVRQRIPGKVQQDTFTDSYMLYDSTKGSQTGVSHYSLTLSVTGPERGSVALRVILAPAPVDPNPTRPRNPALGGLSNEAVQRYWTPVEDCAAQLAKPAA